MLKGQKKNIPMNLVGNVYGRLTVLSLARRGTDDRKYYYWLCRCNCGVEKVIHQELLRSGRTKSCGCLLLDSRKAKGNRNDVMLRKLYHSLKKRHHKRFSESKIISFESLKKLSIKECFYCGSIPISKQEDIRYDRRGDNNKVKISDAVLFTNGIDRIDSSLGYTLTNVVSCCKHCNTAKSSLSQEEFKALVRRIYFHWAMI